MTFCSSCGAGLTETARFCAGCGAAVQLVVLHRPGTPEPSLGASAVTLRSTSTRTLRFRDESFNWWVAIPAIILGVLSWMSGWDSIEALVGVSYFLAALVSGSLLLHAPVRHAAWRYFVPLVVAFVGFVVASATFNPTSA